LTSTRVTSRVLTHASLRIIADGQAASGAYIASPSFSQYGFGWLRDGAYCAMSMDAAGERDSAARFHEWAVAVVLRQAGRIRDIVSRTAGGETVPVEHMLPTRYTLSGEGEEHGDDVWPNFQLDGYGTWLFAFDRHVHGSPSAAEAEAVALVAEYLVATWERPCYDYWEEFGDRVHTSTLAAVAAGLSAAATLLDRPEFGAAAASVVARIEADCVVGGAFVKGPDDARVDASLISLATPFGVFSATDPRMEATIARIQRELMSPSGGVRRYVGDTYYGGSPWMLLTAWLGWHLRLVGDADGYAAARSWVEDHADENGTMAEQITDEPQDPAFVEPWVRRWGPVADPLLWSHAKFLLMEHGA